MVGLSSRTKSHVAALFRAQDVAAAERLLVEECGANLPILGASGTPESLERVRFAALRLSGGRIDRLRDAVALAKTDWRDLLVAAGFADDIRAHEAWQPRRLDAEDPEERGDS
jgi:hypothetical protein